MRLGIRKVRLKSNTTLFVIILLLCFFELTSCYINSNDDELLTDHPKTIILDENIDKSYEQILIPEHETAFSENLYNYICINDKTSSVLSQYNIYSKNNPEFKNIVTDDFHISNLYKLDVDNDGNYEYFCFSPEDKLGSLLYSVNEQFPIFIETSNILEFKLWKNTFNSHIMFEYYIGALSSSYTDFFSYNQELKFSQYFASAYILSEDPIIKYKIISATKLWNPINQWDDNIYNDVFETEIVTEDEYSERKSAETIDFIEISLDDFEFIELTVKDFSSIENLSNKLIDFVE